MLPYALYMKLNVNMKTATFVATCKRRSRAQLLCLTNIPCCRNCIKRYKRLVKKLLRQQVFGKNLQFQSVLIFFKMSIRDYFWVYGSLQVPSDIRAPTSDVRDLISNIRHPTSQIWHPTDLTSEIRHPATSEIRHPASDTRHPRFDIRHLTSDIRDSTSDIRHTRFDIRHLKGWPWCVVPGIKGPTKWGLKGNNTNYTGFV